METIKTMKATGEECDNAKEEMNARISDLEGEVNTLKGEIKSKESLKVKKG